MERELAAEASAELASVHVEFGDHEEAVPRYQSALAMQKAAFGELSAPVLGTLDALAASLAEAEPPIGGSELAEQALRSALPLKQALGGRTSQAVADCHNELSVLLQGRGEFELAEEEARRALHVYKQLFGDLHVFTATAVNNLALLLQAQGALPQAEVEVRKPPSPNPKPEPDPYPDPNPNPNPDPDPNPGERTPRARGLGRLGRLGPRGDMGR